ncbi:glutathione S-transferase N-terminal domain-containing protein [Desulforhopalus singaporensis]|uniref:glutathione S-transferase N-terminal domain-containing protein n=1 Tax=Desulforhopalus singaporensis TaxID=91360 RepID=UPI0015A268B9
MQLYMREDCPYCRKVERATLEMGLSAGKDYEIINAAPFTPGRDTVLQVGGKAMVPFLIDGDFSMYESDDIIAYLRKKHQG